MSVGLESANGECRKPYIYWDPSYYGSKIFVSGVCLSHCFRTVSVGDRGVIPVGLLAKKRKAIYRCKGELLRMVVAREERQRTLAEWQLFWQYEPNDKWATRLTDSLNP